MPLATDHLHRVAQTPIAMGNLAGGGALGTVRAAIDGTVPAGLLPDPDAVLHFGHHGTADRTVGAHVLPDDAFGRRRAGGLGLADAAERQGAKGGKAARRQAGAAQKGAAIHAAAGLTGKGRHQPAATRLAFAFLDKHGQPP